jgi:uncharacterized protein (UPF0332 family)
MKPETARFVEFAHDMLRRAGRMSSIDLHDDAGRAAYLACFHVAQAVIFERGGRVLKNSPRRADRVQPDHERRPARR